MRLLFRFANLGLLLSVGLAAQAARLRAEPSMMSPPAPLVTYDERWSGNTSSYNERKFSVTKPVMKTEKETMSLSLLGSQIQFGDTIFLDSGTELPTELSRVEIGTLYFHQLEGRRNWGLRGIIGYAGDELFKHGRDVSFTVTAHYGFPGTGYGFWMWTVFLSNNSPLLNYVPLPGFVYFYKTGTFTGLFGLPFATMKWRPTIDWSLGLSVVGTNVSSEIAYGSLDTWQFFTGFNWSRQSFILTDRAPRGDRLTLEEKKYGFGIRTPLLDMLDAEVQASYVYDRSIYMGQGLSNRDRGSARVNSSPYVSASMKAEF